MTTYKRKKAVLKSYLYSNFDLRFLRKMYSVSKNRQLLKRDTKKLIELLLEQIKKSEAREITPELIGEMFRKCFTNAASEDRMLYLAEDCFVAAVIHFLYDHRKEERKEKYFQRATALFSASCSFDYEKLYFTYSKVHRLLMKRNFLCYAESDDLYRRYIKSLVYAYAKKHSIKDFDAVKLIEESYPEKKRKTRVRSYMILLAVLFSAFSVFVLLFCGILPFLFLLFPIATLSYEIVCTVASVFVKPAPIPKLKNKKIDKYVLVVITTLITSENAIKEFEKRLRIMAYQNKEEKITFGLLADFKDSPTQISSEDAYLTKRATESIQKLNNEGIGHFCLFIRSRRKSLTENRYMGWERKRGALIELVRWIKGKNSSFETVLGDTERLKQTDYILTLDSDTDLRIGAVSTLYSAMVHPQNKPVIQNGVVISGYGVLQPRMITTTESASASPFSVLYEGGGGIDSYQNVLFDFYQSVFGKGAFCGKGMFDVHAFDEVIDGAFPENQILSHDLLEGTRLRCGYLSEYPLTDSTPTTALSHFKRLHRWLRGDFQALPFAFPLSEEKNPIDAPSRFMIISNVVRALTPVFALLSLFLSTLFNEATCAVFLLFSFAYLLFPPVYAIIRTAKYVTRRFYSTVMQNIWQSLCSTFYSLSALCYNAEIALDAALRVFYRKTISGKKLLEWETAGEGERKHKGKRGIKLFLLYYRKCFPTIIIGILMLLFAGGGVVRLFGLSFLLFPAISYKLSIPYRKKTVLSEKQRRKLIEYACDSFAYYEKFVTKDDHDLPPDNYQELPVSVIAHRTSPTNIALYLTSVMSVFDLGVADAQTTSNRLLATLKELERLPKYKGHLYNWYDTQTEEVLRPAYISTVDSGNLALALLIIKEGLNDLDGVNTEIKAEIAKILDDLLQKMDFSFLYNRKKGLLCIGYDPISEKQSENCYDLLASEARSAYYYAIAKGDIPVSAWGKLMRPITERGGYLGLYSWSGTMFEYFMPALFLPIYENTLLYEALCFALFEQIKDKSEGMWGRSESCYFSFDPQMNYQYKAFGSAVLAMDMTVSDQDVLAPYASFLALILSPSLALYNLSKMEKSGLYGQYGFYDAIDFTPSRVGNGSAVIKNYMAHHVGMSITAIANVCCDRVFIRRGMRNIDLVATSELLKERIPSDEPATEEPHVRSVRAGGNAVLSFFGQTAGKPEKQQTDYALLYKGPYSVLANGIGTVNIKYKDISLSAPPGINECSPLLPILAMKDSSETVNLLSEKSRFFYDGKQIGYTNESGAHRATVHILPSDKGILIRTVLAPLPSYESTAENKTELIFSALLPLCSSKEYITHPAFTGLAVESKTDAEHRLLIYKRRKYDQNRPEMYFGVYFPSSLPEVYISKADDLPDFYSADELIKGVAQATDSSKDGPVRKPVIAFKTARYSEGKQTIDFFFTASDSEKGLYENIKKLSGEEVTAEFENRIRQKNIGGKQTPGYLYDRTTIDYVSLLLFGIFQKRKQDLILPAYPIEQLWQFGISGDYPVLCFLIPKEYPLQDSQKRVISSVLRGYRHISGSGIPFDLVFIRKEEELYFSPGQRELADLIAGVIGNSRPKKSGGVHLLFHENAADILPSFSKVFITLDRDCYFDELKKQFAFFLSDVSSKELPERCQNASSEETDCSGLALSSVILGENGVTVFPSPKHPPYSFIYASRQFGTLLTDKSLGFTWFCNAGESRLTPYSGEELSSIGEERMILTVDGKDHDLALSASSVRFGSDCASYRGSIGVLDYLLQVGVDEKLPVKTILLKITNRAPVVAEAEVRYCFDPCLGKQPDGQIIRSKQGNTVFYKRTACYHAHTVGMYLYSSDKKITVASMKDCTVTFLLGTVHLNNDRCYYHVLEKFKSPEKLLSSFSEYKESRQSLFSAFSLKTEYPAMDLMFNQYLPYQILSSRLFGRTGLYQPGGAYGFRDQLQDALAILPYDKDITKCQLLRSAAHQFYEGDVQHWWHRVDVIPGKGDAGVRTECSDDLLWMPYVLSKYLERTEDVSILDIRIPYLCSSFPEMSQSDSHKIRKERYERPNITKRKESMYDHCVRAIDLVIRRRENDGLCGMGSCDWNDGFSEVRGKSVWLTQFLLLTVRAFLPFARSEEKKRYEALLPELRNAIENCFDKDRYLRAFFKSGEPLGKAGNRYCSIDLLPQSFAVFLEKNDRSRLAINTAYRHLWEEKEGIFRLFAPGYDSEEKSPGYLGGYCPGFRENGGQYTHAAVWGAMALLRAGEHEKGFHVLNRINPITKTMESDAYQIEPYAMAGDVYYAKGFEGRGGWSQYTGAAGWYQTAVLTELLGYAEHPRFFTLHPKLCDAFSGFTLEIRKKETFYHIEVCRGEETKIILDEKASENRFFFDKQPHKLKMVIAKI